MHTKGPWSIVEAADHVQIHAKGFKGSLARIDWKDDRGASDALLIAAAPTLLEALKHVNAVVSSEAFHDQEARLKAWAAVSEAIRTAEGKEG